MSDELPPSIANKLPAPTKNAADVAKVVTSVAAAVAAAVFPEVAVEAAMAGAALPIAIDRFINKPRDLLLKALSKGEIVDLSAERVAPLIPMAYKFLEAAKQGEYEHNLEILAAYLVGEMKRDIPDAANFSRMARRVEGLSRTDLKVMALIDALKSSSSVIRIYTDEPTMTERPFVSATFIKNLDGGKDTSLTRTVIAESLVDLLGRGFLVADGATRTDKSEEYYRPTQSFLDLIERARKKLKPT